MTVNGKRDNISRNDILISARNMGVKKAEAENIISDVQKSLENWENYAGEAALRESAADKIQRSFIKL